MLVDIIGDSNTQSSSLKKEHLRKYVPLSLFFFYGTIKKIIYLNLILLKLSMIDNILVTVALKMVYIEIVPNFKDYFRTFQELSFWNFVSSLLSTHYTDCLYKKTTFFFIFKKKFNDKLKGTSRDFYTGCLIEKYL